MSEALPTAWLVPPPVAEEQPVEWSGQSVDQSASAEERFGVIVTRFGDEIGRFVRRMLSGSDDPEDVTQEVFARAWQQFEQADSFDNVRAWLYRIAVNRCRSHLRRRRVRDRWRRWVVRSEPRSEEAADAAVNRDEIAREVRRAIAALPTEQREVIVLFYLEHHDIATISDLLGVRANTIEVRLHRARRKLEKLLGPLATSNRPL